jgi:DNA-binding ferritin-like protein (Dps family)
MYKLIDTLIGDINGKKAFNANEKRAKALPREYAKAYKEMKQYIFATSGLLSMEPLVALVDILEEAAANKRKVTDITGPNVAAFIDELVRDSRSWQDTQRQKLNKSFSKDK